MVSDVPLGSFLSGGVDSSAIVAAMSADGRACQHATSIGFERGGPRHEIVPDDCAMPAALAKLFETDYHEQILEPDVLELLPKAIWHLEEPVADPAAISTYLICRAAGARMPVMLSGMGGDEIFAGYPRYLAYGISRLARPLPRPLAARRSSALRRRCRAPGPPGPAARPAAQPVEVHARRRPAAVRALPRVLELLHRRPSSRALLAPELRRRLGGYDPLARHRALPRCATAAATSSAGSSTSTRRRSCPA